MRVFLEKHRREVTLGDEVLGRGGEATVRPVTDALGAVRLVVKLYHKPQREHAEKVSAMIARPPQDPMRDKGHPSIAWPTDRAFSGDGPRRFLGFLMPRVDGARPLVEIFNPRARQQADLPNRYDFLLRTARNLAATADAVHKAGYVIGDLREANILVSRALVTLVDTDSFQVPSGARVFRCPVGTPEYTPPELQGVNFAEVDRAPEHDAFALAVLIFQLLMQGVHPFAGVYTGKGEPPGLRQRIQLGHWPYSPAARAGRATYTPSPSTPPWEVLPPSVQELLLQALEQGFREPHRRPDAHQWVVALREAEKELQPCPANANHVYRAGLRECPWCRMAQQLRRDPFPPPMGATSVSSRGRPSPRQALPPRPQTQPASPPRVSANPRRSRRLWLGIAGTAAALLVAVTATLWAMHRGEKPPAVSRALAGDRARDQGDYDRAVALYGEALNQAPDDPALYYGRGEAYRRRGDYPLAIADFTEAIRRGASAEAYRDRGCARLRWGFARQAVQDLDEAIRLAPEDAVAWAARAEARGELGEDDRAASDCEVALRCDPENAVAYRQRSDVRAAQGDHAGALEDWARALQLAPGDGTTYGLRGLAWQWRGLRNKARPELDEALRLLKEPDPQTLLLRSSVYGAKKEYNEALAACGRALKLNPDCASGYIARAGIYYRKRDNPRALEDLDEALKRDPTNVRGLVWRSRVCLAVKDPDGALADAREAARLDHSLYVVHIALGRCHQARNEYDEALRSFDRAVQLAPQQAAALAARSRCYKEQKEYEMAINDLNVALDREPDNPHFLIDRGFCYLDQGNDDLAKADFMDAAAADDTEADAYFGRGMLLLRQKKYGEAVEAFTAAANRDDTSPWVYCRRGDAYYGQNDLDKAVADYEKACELDRTNGEAQFGLGLIREERKEYDLAIGAFDAAIRFALRRDGRAFERSAQYHRAQCLRLRKDFKQAIADYNDALKGSPVADWVPLALNGRGIAHAALGEHAQAVEDYTEALKRAPGNPVYLYNRGVTFLAWSKPEKALEDLDASLAKATDFAEAYWQRGEAYSRLGHADKAREDREKAVKLKPTLRQPEGAK